MAKANVRGIQNVCRKYAKLIETKNRLPFVAIEMANVNALKEEIESKYESVVVDVKDNWLYVSKELSNIYIVRYRVVNNKNN